jgi:hypothetical protein
MPKFVPQLKRKLSIPAITNCEIDSDFTRFEPVVERSTWRRRTKGANDRSRKGWERRAENLTNYYRYIFRHDIEVSACGSGRSAIFKFPTPGMALFFELHLEHEPDWPQQNGTL